MPESSRPSSAESSDTHSEIMQPVEAKLFKKKLRIVVANNIFQDQLRSKGFGETEDSDYILKSYEALYLSYTKRLTIKHKDETVNFDGLMRVLLKHDKNLFTKFLIYRDLRSKGYTPKEGFGFGADFRVYEKGEFERQPAKYDIFGINEGTKIKASNLSKMIDEIGKMGKYAVAAVIERRGEVIYYKVSRIPFYNKKTRSV